MSSEIQEYLRDAVLPEKFQIFVEVETLFDELSITECQSKILNLILSLGDSGSNDLVDDIENLYTEYLEQAVNLHGLSLNADVDKDMDFLARIMRALLAIPTSVMRYSALDLIDDAESDDLDLLFGILELQDPELSEHLFFETFTDVSRSLIDRLEEIIEQDLDNVSSDSLIVHTEARVRYMNTPKALIEGPVRDFLLNGGTYSQDIKSLEIALSDHIAVLPTIEEKATQCIIAAIISSAETFELETAAQYIAGGVVETFEETSKINLEVTKQLKDFGLNNGY